jgi:molybdopterin-guanine dinucleotide biosynthesis protein A
MTSIVLAGGRSLRLGQNKLTMTMAGQSLMQRVIACLVPLGSEVIVAFSQRGENPALPFPEVKAVFDLYPGKGALGGIYTGIITSGSFHNLVVACDMPFLNVELLRYLSQLSPGFDVVLPKLGRNVEPLHAIYAKSCLEPIAELLRQGDLRITSLFNSVKVRYVDQEEIDRFDPEHLSFFNINTKADLEKAQELLNAHS